MRNLLMAFFAVLVAFQVACTQEPKGVETENGHRLINYTNNSGPKVQPGDIILVNVDTYILDSLMGSTRKSGAPREIKLPTRDKIAGKPPAIFDAALLMAEGDSAKLIETIDSSKAKFLPEKLKDAKEIHYVIKLLKVTTKEQLEQEAKQIQARFPSVQAEMTQFLADYNGGKLKDKTTVTPSGLGVMIVDKGSGAPLAVGQNIKTHYYGTLLNGKMFDNSFERGEPLAFPVGTGRMIPGYDEGAQLLNHGGKAYFILPAKLAYGDKGTPDGAIPPNANIVFYVEIL